MKKTPWYKARLWSGMDLFAWLRLLMRNRLAVSPSRWPLAASITLFATCNTALRWTQNLWLGRRIDRYAAKEGVSPEQWLFRFLYDPRANPNRAGSRCPAYRFLFVEKPVYGARSRDALPVPAKDGGEVLPGAVAFVTGKTVAGI